MRYRRAAINHVLAVALFVVISQPCAIAQAAKTELEGTWDGQMSIGRAGATRGFTAGEMWITFEGNQSVAKNFLGPEGTKHRFEVNPKTTPKQFDFFRTEGQPPVVGIYEIKGDLLTIAISFTSERPKGFNETDQTFRISTLKLKRRPKGAARVPAWVVHP